MSIHEEATIRSRRSGDEVRRLVSEFAASGLRVSEFCRGHGLATSTLRRHLKRPRGGDDPAQPAVRLMAVKVKGQAPPSSKVAGAPALEVILAGGRRIGVGPAFEAPTLSRVVQVLEEG